MPRTALKTGLELEQRKSPGPSHQSDTAAAVGLVVGRRRLQCNRLQERMPAVLPAGGEVAGLAGAVTSHCAPL